MEVDPTRVCELLIGLGEVTVLGAVDEAGAPLLVHVETRHSPPRCPGCGGAVWVKDQRRVELVDLPAFGRPFRLVWAKRRWRCPAVGCRTRSFTETAPAIAAPRLAMTDRAGRWVTEQVGRYGRPVTDLVRELGCDWHTINDTVLAYGTPLVEDPARIGTVEALGLDEVLFARGRAVAHPGVVESVRRRRRRAAARCGARAQRGGGVRLARGPRPVLAHGLAPAGPRPRITLLQAGTGPHQMD